jgi:hypothetical protein
MAEKKNINHMAAPENLLAFRKTEEFYIWLYPVLLRFPKAERFVLGQRIEQRTIAVMEDLAEATSERYRVPAVKRASLDLDVLRVLLRAAHSLKFINTKQYGAAASRLEDVGNLIGGLLRAGVAPAPVKPMA